MKHGIQTRAIHAGQEPDPTTGAVMTPIYAVSTFAQSAPGVHKGYEYSRSANPTRTALEECLASLEGGARGFAFASGLAAESALLDLLPKNAHVIASDDLYGGTVRLFDRVKGPASGLEVSYVDMSQPDEMSRALRPETRMIWIETPSNPLLKLIDLEQTATFARQHGLLSVCDNTFATPVIQRPLEVGFDLVVHSVTKYINGHSDVVGGAVVVRESGDLADQVGFVQNATGGVLSPFDSFLVLRGIKTLPLRIKAHSESAAAVADFLASHPQVERVIYPGRTDHPQHALAQKQMAYPGGMVSFFIRGGLDAARRFFEQCRIFTLAESLGGVESLAEHPAIMTHASVPEQTRKKLGIDDSLIRLSVGLEDPGDLIDDLDSALSARIPSTDCEEPVLR